MRTACRSAAFVAARIPSKSSIIVSLVLRSFLLSGVSVAAVGVAQAQQAAPTNAAVNFSIPAQPLSAAINAFIKQSGWQISYSSALASGKTSNAVSGSYTPTQALQLLVAGTGIDVRSGSVGSAALVDANAAGNDTGAMVDGAIALDTIDVSGGSIGNAALADAPYETPGSSSFISAEQLARIPATSPGDVFINTPGVINGNRVGTSLNPNIRGLQGMGRVNTTIDGARQNTSTYRGYTGNRDETYIDPDMVGGIDISKGPSTGAGVGGIGGSINFRTLEAADILKPGETSGARIKASLGGNASKPPAAGTTTSADRPDFYGDSFSGSFATAVIAGNYEAVAAYSKRQQGNYFSGTKLPDGLLIGSGTNAGAQVKPGSEVFNTSEDTESFLAKGKASDGEQSLQLSYLFYGSNSGQISDLFLVTGFNNNQYDPTYTRVDTYAANYRYTPSDNDLVNFRANLWFTDLFSERFLATIDKPYGTRTVGGDIGNTSTFDLGFGALSVDAGAEFVREHATAEQFASTVTYSGGWETYGPSGTRLMASAYTSATFKPTDWAKFSGGVRYDYYQSEGEGYLAAYPDKSDSGISPNVSMTLEPTDGVQLYAQYVEGMRPPSLRETHWHYQGLLVNNPNLGPEYSRNKEVGLNILRDDVLIQGDKLRFKASYFDNSYDDYIIRYLRETVPARGNVYHWANIEGATYRGFELSGAYDARKFFVEAAFTKYTKIEYCRDNIGCATPAYGTVLGGATSPTASDYVSNYIPPEYSGSVTAGVRLFDETLTLGARMHFAGLRMGSSWNGASASRIGIDTTWPKYQIFDAFGSYQITDDMLLNFSVENITDEYYFGALASVGIPSPGRTVRLGLTHHIGGDAIPQVAPLTLGRAASGAPGSDWTGLYFGGFVGYSFADLNGTTTAADGTAGGIPATESARIDLENVQNGLRAGVNYQFGNRFVVGLEGDFSWLKHQGIQQALVTESSELADAGWLQADTEYSLDWMATLRGRVGYAWDRYLLYGTGGLAFLKEDQTRTQYQSDVGAANRLYGRKTEEFFKETASGIRLGWTAGAGFEYAIDNHWSLTGEYSFTGFGIEKFLFSNARQGISKGWSTTTICRPNNSTPPCPGGVTTVIRETTPGTSETVNGRKASNELDLQLLKLGVNYRF
ncbi:TonB-dependent receptor [Hyphomicrobium sp. D-2]|uniref:TonB-dependent receptor domain-containing protein n=1 Tax=Hyphomicrobium sp. D-2 TaxID=3041621 RepID=UPI002455588F|nr:TonB-dependent receptor [Hyphomicrobium sp. D-2]MDH4983708.1 TonB-dependent receptor [Hyphomicrobium sp. D-2]